MTYKGRPSGFAQGSASASFSRISASVSTSTDSCCSIDLRDEFDKLIYGTGDCPRRGYWAQIWYAKRNADGSLQYCVCTGNKGGDADRHCSYCRGIGHYWTQKWLLTRHEYIGSEGGLGNRDRWSPAGTVDADTKLFFLRYDLKPRKDDYIVEVLLDEEGNIVHDGDGQPIYIAYYKPQTIDPKRDENGRVEFWQVYCLESEAIRPNVYEA